MKSILIANRGEIACRVIRTCRRLGIRSIAVYSDADGDSLHVKSADEAIRIGEGASADSYLAIDKIVQAVKRSRAEAIHPGYGFLAENAEFAARLAAEGITFLGPRPDVILALGDKIRSKDLAQKANVPVVPSLTLLPDEAPKWKEQVSAFGKKAGYPLLVKASAGGGGRGMRRINSVAEIEDAVNGATREAESFFKDGRIFVEKLIEEARHVEVQIFGDNHGDAMHFWDRDCTVQRNHQKVIEEAPAPNIDNTTREEMLACAVRLCREAGYSGAGTVEFLYKDGHFYFLEVNSRLQVEHPVTEAITNVDLVELQIRIGRGERLKDIYPSLTPPGPHGTAMESRICAEAPSEGFVASTGEILDFDFPDTGAVRLDTGFGQGDTVTHFYDSLLAKLIVSAPSRAEAIERMQEALEGATVSGVKTNTRFLLSILNAPAFRTLTHHTNWALSLLPTEEMLRAEAVRLSLLAFASESNPCSSADAWGTGDAFRMIGSPERVRICRFSKQTIEVSNRQEGANFSIHSGSLSSSLTDLQRRGDAFSALLDGKPISWRMRARDDKIWISSASGHDEVQLLAPKLKVATAQGEKDNVDILSPLPGKVLEVKVLVGQKVLEGDVLLILESMKMEHIVKASSPSIVTGIFTSPGATVMAEEKLIEVNRDGPSYGG